MMRIVMRRCSVVVEAFVAVSLVLCLVLDSVLSCVLACCVCGSACGVYWIAMVCGVFVRVVWCVYVVLCDVAIYVSKLRCGKFVDCWRALCLVYDASVDVSVAVIMFCLAFARGVL